MCHSCGFDFPKKEKRMGLSCCGRLFRWISCKFLCCCYLNAVALPDRRPHGQRGRRYAANTVQQWQAGTRSHRVGHLTGEQREAAQGKATCAHAIGQLMQLLFFVHIHFCSLIRQSVKLSFGTVMQSGGFDELTVSHVFIALTQASTPLTGLLKRALRLDPDHLLRHSCDGHPSKNEEDTKHKHVANA